MNSTGNGEECEKTATTVPIETVQSEAPAHDSTEPALSVADLLLTVDDEIVVDGSIATAEYGNKENTVPLCTPPRQGTPTSSSSSPSPPKIRKAIVPKVSLTHALNKLARIHKREARSIVATRKHTTDHLQSDQEMAQLKSSCNSKLRHLSERLKKLDSEARKDTQKVNANHDQLTTEIRKTQEQVSSCTNSIRIQTADCNGDTARAVAKATTDLLGEIKVRVESANAKPQPEQVIVMELCTLCKRQHPIEDCTTYRTSTQKREAARENGLCQTCLEPVHLAEPCPAAETLCKHCQNPGHSPILCSLAEFDARAEAKFAKSTTRTQKARQPDRQPIKRSALGDVSSNKPKIVAHRGPAQTFTVANSTQMSIKPDTRSTNNQKPGPSNSGAYPAKNK